MRIQFTQGSILEDVRSKRYNGIRCKGVVITARCDIFNDKVNDYHYLTAISLSDWIYEIIYFEIIDELINDVMNNIKGYAKDKKLDYETLVSFGIDRVKIVLEANAKGQKEITKVNEWIEKWKRYNEYQQKEISRELRKDILMEYGTKKLKNKIKPVYNGPYKKFCFIPSQAYKTDSSLVDGIVIDLQDIHQVDKRIISDILAYKYDFKLIDTIEEREIINKAFFFENENDFVIVDNKIESPWIEYLLQLFANTYIRIGVDNANEDEITKYCESFLREI